MIGKTTSPLLIIAIAISAVIAGWGIADPEGLGSLASAAVAMQFQSRGWFIMLEASGLLFVALFLAFSRFGTIRLGPDGSEPEFSTPAWIAMLFAAGMGVGLLFYGAAEPLTHFEELRKFGSDPQAAGLCAVRDLSELGVSRLGDLRRRGAHHCLFRLSPGPHAPAQRAGGGCLRRGGLDPRARLGLRSSLDRRHRRRTGRLARHGGVPGPDWACGPHRCREPRRPDPAGLRRDVPGLLDSSPARSRAMAWRGFRTRPCSSPWGSWSICLCSGRPPT